MNRIVVLVAIALAFVAWKRREESRFRAVVARSQASSNSCTGKDQCAVVYVTPWCPSCKALKPKIQAVLEKGNTDPAFGMRVIVGLGQTPADNIAEAASYGAFASIDDDGAFRKAYGIEAYPTVLLLDRDQHVAGRGQVAVNQMLARAYPGIRLPPIPPGLPPDAIGFP